MDKNKRTKNKQQRRRRNDNSKSNTTIHNTNNRQNKRPTLPRKHIIQQPRKHKKTKQRRKKTNKNRKIQQQTNIHKRNIPVMKISKHPFRYNYRELYPDAKMIGEFEGGAIYKAEKNDKYYLIIDEGTMADFLDEDDKDLLNQLVKIIEFETEEELNNYLGERYRKFIFK